MTLHLLLAAAALIAVGAFSAAGHRYYERLVAEELRKHGSAGGH